MIGTHNMHALVTIPCTFIEENISVPILESSFFVFLGEVFLVALTGLLCLFTFVLHKGFMQHVQGTRVHRICWVFVCRPIFFNISVLLGILAAITPTLERKRNFCKTRDIAIRMHAG